MNMRYARTLGLSWQDVQPTKDGEMEPVPQPNLIKDALYYLHPDVATNEKYIAVARGQLSGTVTTVMALTGKTFEEAIEFIVPYLPERVEMKAVPTPWHEAFQDALIKAIEEGSR